MANGHCGTGRCLNESCACACEGCVEQDEFMRHDADLAAERAFWEAEMRLEAEAEEAAPLPAFPRAQEGGCK